MTTHKWEPIKDLPENWHVLSSTELEGLASIWQEQSAQIQKRDALKQFNERLGREWAIETGIIENLYSIDRGITQLLIEKGIEASLIPHGATDKPAEQIVLILKDQEEVLEGLFDFIAQRRVLSTSYVKELHQALTRHQETVEAINGLGRLVEIPLQRGLWKEQSNNPTRPSGELAHEYCPPQHVGAEMDQLIHIHLEHTKKGVPPEVEAAWLHHRFTQIHPFQDGNGRMARALASLVFLRAKWFPLVIHRDIRDEYISDLESADEGDLSPLIQLFAKIQKQEFLKALSLSENVLREPSPLHRVISLAIDRVRARKRLDREQMQHKAFLLSQHLEDALKIKLDSIASELSDGLQAHDTHYFAITQQCDESNRFWFKKQIVETARTLDYYADTRTYSSWVRLKIKEDRQTELVFSFHALGVDFFGIMAASAFMEYRDKSEEGETSVDGPHIISKEVFQFSYKEAEPLVFERFQQWLSEVLLTGLDQWRRQL